MNTTSTPARPPRASLLAILPCIALLAAATLTSPALHAETIGYWRFEGDATTWLKDSSGHNLNLSPFTRSGQTDPNPLPARYTLPASGAGANFPRLIAENANVSAMQGTGANLSFNHRQLGVDISAHDDNLTSAFSFEAFVNLSSSHTTDSAVLAGQGVSLSSGASWALAITGSGSARGARNILFQINTGGGSWGTSLQTLQSNLYLDLGKDYYIAVTADFTDTTSAGITIYLKDLSTPGAILQRASLTHTGSIASTAAALSIGAAEGGGSPWYGTIDEVRLSDVKLAESQLLISQVQVPEPSASAFISAFVACALLIIMRRHHHR
ncbi:LamG domain-containing protein [Opitutaceae bacterium TAV4]|nr:LamG domain-containing protein [Opitutaceae bacterium TAV4]RRJ99252.1 LamG domain-containing protein [Opitutaceae bacterium TAV3]